MSLQQNNQLDGYSVGNMPNELTRHLRIHHRHIGAYEDQHERAAQRLHAMPYCKLLWLPPQCHVRYDNSRARRLRAVSRWSCKFMRQFLTMRMKRRTKDPGKPQ